MPDLWIAVVIGGLSIITISSLAYAYHIKRSRKYYRERYALAALPVIFSLSALAIISVASVPPWTIVAALFKYVTNPGIGFEIPSSPHWAEKILIFLFAYYVIKVIYQFFHSWDEGYPRSVAQVKRESLADADPMLHTEAWDELKYLLKRQKRKVFDENLADRSSEPFDQPETESLAWHEEAKKLLTLKWNIHSFSKYYKQQTCWIGKNRQTNAITALFCCHEHPTDLQLQAFVQFVKDQNRDATFPFEWYVAIRHGDMEETKEIVSGVEIRFFYKKSMLDDLVDFREYFNYIGDRVEKDQLTGYDKTILDIYTPSLIEDDQGETIDENLEQYLEKWLTEPGPRQLALLGEFGQGKSTGALMFTYHLIQKYGSHCPRIPLIIELRGKIPYAQDALGFLSDWCGRFNINANALMMLIKAGRVLLIFEGCDEMANVYRAEDKRAHFRALWQFCYQKSKILITGRANFFENTPELRDLLVVQPPQAHRFYTEYIKLKPFDLEQIEDSLRESDVETREGILKQAGKGGAFLDLVARPSLLYTVSRLWHHRELQENRENITSARVISLFLRDVLSRQTSKVRKHREQYMWLFEKERLFFMHAVAVKMAKEKWRNQIENHELTRLVRFLIEKMPDTLNLSTDHDQSQDMHDQMIKRAPKQTLKSWVNSDEEAIDKIVMEIKSCGILVKDFSRDNTFKFAHKSFFELLFCEYGFGRFVYKTKIDNRSAGMKFLNKEVGLNWQEYILHNDTTFSLFVDLIENEFEMKEDWCVVWRRLFGSMNVAAIKTISPFLFMSIRSELLNKGRTNFLFVVYITLIPVYFISIYLFWYEEFEVLLKKIIGLFNDSLFLLFYYPTVVVLLFALFNQTSNAKHMRFVLFLMNKIGVDGQSIRICLSKSILQVYGALQKSKVPWSRASDNRFVPDNRKNT
ncbi:NACHT domain-containing protein [Magnetococcales bacterium HHB-1]